MPTKRDRAPLSLIERAASFLAPGWGMKRERLRAMREMNTQLSAHAGAAASRFFHGWVGTAGSADADILPELPMLRQRSRDLSRSDGYAAGIINKFVVEVISTGIRPQSKLDLEELGIDEDRADRLQRKMEKVFERWAEKADITGRMDFAQLQGLLYGQRLLNGDGLALVRMKARPRVRYKLCLQAVEADRLETPWARPAGADIRSGVELGEDGEPVAYWVRRTHPGDCLYTDTLPRGLNSWERIPALNAFGRPLVLHTYSCKRSGQTRGFPLLTPVMALFKNLSDYQEAEIVAARVAACYALFIKKTNPFSTGEATATDPETGELQDDGAGNRIQDLAPGMVEYLADNEDVVNFAPNRPNAAFPSFIEINLRNIAAGTGSSYEEVARDYTRANYSNMRSSKLDARRCYRMEQYDFSRTVCAPLWPMLMEEAWLLGELDVEDFMIRVEDWTRSRWITPGWPWVNPKDEISASVEAIKNNLSCGADEAAAQGRDIDDIMDQNARERRRQRKLGIVNDDLESQVDQRLIKLGLPLPMGDMYQRYGRQAPQMQPVPGDASETLEREPALRYDDNNIYSYHIQFGLLTINEVRAKLGFPPVEWGNVPCRTLEGIGVEGGVDTPAGEKEGDQGQGGQGGKPAPSAGGGATGEGEEEDGADGAESEGGQ